MMITNKGTFFYPYFKKNFYNKGYVIMWNEHLEVWIKTYSAVYSAELIAVEEYQ